MERESEKEDKKAGLLKLEGRNEKRTNNLQMKRVPVDPCSLYPWRWDYKQDAAEVQSRDENKAREVSWQRWCAGVPETTNGS